MIRLPLQLVPTGTGIQILWWCCSLIPSAFFFQQLSTRLSSWPSIQVQALITRIP
jgi:hypothetical protein